MGNVKRACEACGKALEIDGEKLCRACTMADTSDEPDFERLLELRNDGRAFARDGDEA